MKINPMYVRPNYAELDATKVPTDRDIAWAAGFYEGEGCVRLCGKKKRGLALHVPQKDPETLYWLRDWFGGSVCAPPPSNNCYTWNCCGDRARIFLALIYPFLSARRKEQVDSTGALDYLRGTSSTGMSIGDLKTHLLKMYEEHSKTTYRGNASARRKQRYQERKQSDPGYVAGLVAKNRVRKAKNQQECNKVVNISEIA